MRRPLTTASLIWRQIRATRASLLALGLAITIGALLLSAAPQAINAISAAETAFQIHAVSPNQSYPTATVTDPVTGSGADSDLPTSLAAVWGRFDTDLAGVRDAADPTVRGILGPAGYRVTSQAQPLTGTEVTGPTGKLVLAADPRIDRLVDIVTGTAPRTTSTPGMDEPLEVMLSERSAQQLRVSVGSVSSLVLSDGSTQPVVISGTFRAKHPEEPYWSLNRTTLQAEVFDDGNTRPSVTATVYVDAAAYPLVRGLFVVPTARVWYPVRDAAVAAADLEEVSAGLRRFLGNGYQIAARPADPTTDRVRTATLALRSDLPPVIDRITSRLSATAAVLAVMSAGPLGVLLAVLALAGRLVLLRQYRAATLVASRGASGRQIRLLIGLEGLIVGALSALLGAGLAAWLAPGAWRISDVLGPVLLSVLPGVALGAGAAPAYLRSRADTAQRGSERRRWLGELAVVALAVIATTLLLRRGLTATAARGVDPLLAGTPLLLSWAWALVTLRVMPYPVSAYAWIAARRSALVPFLGASRVVRERGAGLAPMVVMVVGVAVALASGLLLTGVREGVSDAARTQVGADVRVTGSVFGTEQVQQIRAIPGVHGTATIFDAGPVTVDVDGTVETAELLVADSTDLATVQRDVPGAAVLPTDLAAAGGPTRVVMSADLAAQSAAAQAVSIGTADVAPVGQARGAAGFGGASTFVLVDTKRAAALLDGAAFLPQTLLVELDPGTDGQLTQTAIGRVLGPDVVIQTPTTVAAAFRAAPVVAGLADALLVAVVSVGVLLVVGLLLSSLLSAAPRHRLLSVLRVLGIDRRSSRRLIAWEFGPAALAAVVGGSLLGLGLVLLVRATVDLRPFTNGQDQPGLGSTGWVLAATTAGFLLLAAATVGLAAWVDRQAGLQTAIRLSEEG